MPDNPNLGSEELRSVSTELQSLSICLKPPRVPVRLLDFSPLSRPLDGTSLLHLGELVIFLMQGAVDIHLGGLEGVACLW